MYLVVEDMSFHVVKSVFKYSVEKRRYGVLKVYISVDILRLICVLEKCAWNLFILVFNSDTRRCSGKQIRATFNPVMPTFPVPTFYSTVSISSRSHCIACIP